MDTDHTSAADEAFGAEADGEADAQDPQPLEGWALLALLAGGIAAASLLGASLVFSEVGLGRASLARGCDPGLAAGLVLLVFGAGSLGLVRVFVDRRFPQEVVFDHLRFWALLPIPAVALILSAPAFLGCRVASEIARAGVLGAALSGTPGIALTGAAAFALGFVPTTAVRTRYPIELLVRQYEAFREATPTRDRVAEALQRVERECLPLSELDDYAQAPGYDPVANPPGAYPPAYEPEEGAPEPEDGRA